MADIQVLHAYRHLYRHGLRAVQFSKPARFTLRDRLRQAFREKDAHFEPRSIARTIQFFQAAARSRGLEHKVLKNLLHLTHRQSRSISTYRLSKLAELSKVKQFRKDLKATGYTHYDMTIAMLNKSMGLCLR